MADGWRSEGVKFWAAMPEGDAEPEPPAPEEPKLVRDTTTFNRYFPPSRYSPEGVFERGKIDITTTSCSRPVARSG